MIIINYLFYDLECANCRNMCAKISSFGYVLTDENFNIIKKENLLINPEAGFYHDDKDTKELVKYEPNNLGDILASPTYLERYELIKELLTDNKILPIGYGNDCDAYYIFESNKRYMMENYDYKFVDVKEIADYVLGKDTKVKGLAKTTKYLNIEYEHNFDSLEDSLATLEVAKELVKRSNLKLKEIVKKANAKYITKKGKLFRLVDNKMVYTKKVVYKDMKVPEEEGYTSPVFKRDIISRLIPHVISNVTDMSDETISFIEYKIDGLLEIWNKSDDVRIAISDLYATKMVEKVVTHLQSVDALVDEIKKMYLELEFKPFYLSFDFIEPTEDDNSN